MKNIILVLLVNILAIVNSFASDQNSNINNVKKSGSQNILFIGNSYLYYNDSYITILKGLLRKDFQIMMEETASNLQQLVVQD